MVHLFKVALALGAAAAVSAEHSYFINGEYDQEGQHRDATCNNNCFFQFFTNKCNSDNPACGCTLHDMRSNYFCCMANNCLPYVVTDAMKRMTDGCIAWNKPIPAFDVEAVCGVKIVAESTSQVSVPTSTTSLSLTTSITSSGASISSTSAASSATSASTTVVSHNTTTATSGSSAHSTSATGAAATSTTAKQGTAASFMVQEGSALLALSALFAAIF
ncbi:hypothetical protein PWT90_07227 [Aphanocladium album]|nr:hypothetical protein PWT90_07227 [Aphanocladium album]